MSKVENFGDVPRRIRELVAEVERLRNNVEAMRGENKRLRDANGRLYREVARLRDIEYWARRVAAPAGANDFPAELKVLRRALEGSSDE